MYVNNYMNQHGVGDVDTGSPLWHHAFMETLRVTHVGLAATLSVEQVALLARVRSGLVCEPVLLARKDYAYRDRAQSEPNGRAEEALT